MYVSSVVIQCDQQPSNKAKVTLNRVRTGTVIQRASVDLPLHLLFLALRKDVSPAATVGRHPHLGQARVERVEQGSAGPQQERLDGVVVEAVVAEMQLSFLG